MIISFRHKGLQELFENGQTRRLPQQRLSKLTDMLEILHSMEDLRDLVTPGFRLHRLKKPPLEGHYSIDVSGNYRLVFRLSGGNVYDLDFLDTH